MLSRLAFILISNMKIPERETDVMVIRTHPLQEVAILTRCFALRVLSPHISLEYDQQ